MIVAYSEEYLEAKREMARRGMYGSYRRNRSLGVSLRFTEQCVEDEMGELRVCLVALRDFIGVAALDSVLYGMTTAEWLVFETRYSGAGAPAVQGVASERAV